MHLESRRTIGLLGSTLLIVGSFAPAISAPIIGDLGLYRGEADFGAATFVCGCAGALVSAFAWRSLLAFVGVGSVAVTAAALQFSLDKINLIRYQAKHSPERDSLVGGLGEIAAEAVQLSWAWGLLFAGAVLLIASAIPRDRKGARTAPAATPRATGESAALARPRTAP